MLVSSKRGRVQVREGGERWGKRREMIRNVIGQKTRWNRLFALIVPPYAETLKPCDPRSVSRDHLHFCVFCRTEADGCK